MLLVLNSPAERLRAYDALNGPWRPHLTVGERDLLAYLIHHTSADGSPLRAHLTQIVDGVTGDFGPLGQSLATLKRLVSALVAKGVLVLERAGGVARWCINYAWRRGGEMVAISRRKQAEMAGQERLNLSRWDDGERLNVSREAHSEPPLVSRYQGDFSPSEETTNQTRGDGSIRHRSRPAPQAQPAPAPSPQGPVRRIIQSVLSRQQGAPAPVSPSSPKRITSSGSLTIDAAWKDGWKGLLPDSPPPPIPRDDRDVLIGLKKRLDRQHGFNSLDFMAWSIANWRQIIAERFAWMTRQPPPPLPAIRFLAKDACLRLFLEAYAAHKDRVAVDRMSDRDEAEIRKRMAQGLTRDKAILEIATERAAAKTRADSEKEREAVRDAYNALQAEKRKLQGGQRIAPAQPHHRPLHERVDPHAWDGIEVDPEQVVDLSRMGLTAME